MSSKNTNVTEVNERSNTTKNWTLTSSGMDRGQPAVLGLAFGVWMEATLGEVNVDVYRTVLLQTLYKQTPANYQQIMPKKSVFLDFDSAAKHSNKNMHLSYLFHSHL